MKDENPNLLGLAACCVGRGSRGVSSNLASSMGTRYCRDCAVQNPPRGLPRTPVRLPRMTALLSAVCVGSMTTACGADFEIRRSLIRVLGRDLLSNRDEITVERTVMVN